MYYALQHLAICGATGLTGLALVLAVYAAVCRLIAD